ncbi:cytochrome b [Undibacterium sp. Ji50W]|uniref:cytochrome b n=1 Tax=Undibacterium sp. Ji50W TaxID=3413041 RepID=UPI003BF22329
MHTTSRISQSDTYDKRTIILHWLSALLVMVLWIAGQTIDFFPTGTPRITVRSLHISFGVLLTVTLFARILWRRSGGSKLPPADAGALGKLAIGVHYLLYALMLAVVVIGIAAVWIRGDNLFNLFTVPAFDPANKALRHNVVELHGLLANILLGLAAFHAAAALWHSLVKKDGVLRRMLPT